MSKNVFTLYFHSVHMHESLCGAAEGGNENFSNIGMDCYYRRVHPRHNQLPSHTHTHTLYNMTVCFPFVQPVNVFSILTYYVFVGGHSLSWCHSGNLCFHFGGESLYFFFCLFLFCKAYDSYCIRASSNNKNCKKLLACFNFIPLYECDGWVAVAQVVQRLEDRFHSYSSLRVKCIKCRWGPQCIHRSVCSPT